jgi:hypothetical protein
MAQKACIELNPGPGRSYRWCGAALWLFAALVLLALLARLPWPLAVAGAALLLTDRPQLRRSRALDGRLRLYRDGGLITAAGAGSWCASGWSSAWLTVLPVQAPGSPRRILVPAWRNAADDYRLLRMWLRYPPEPAPGPDTGGAPR